MATRLQIAKADIVAEFEKQPSVLRRADISAVFDAQREFWRLAKSTGPHAFIDFLERSTPLKAVDFPFKRPVVGYTWGDVPLLEVLLGLVEHSFYSHYTAVRLHGLTEQVPKTIYLNQERRDAPEPPEEPFPQEAIDAAFARPPRISTNEVLHGDARIVYLTSAYHAGLGLMSGSVNYGDKRALQLRYTSLERTLIDIAVRPFYAGGFFEVAKAYENAKDRVSVNTMGAMLKRMEFGYPYHQAIGYYLERAGYKPSVIDIFRKMPMERDFYLGHMEESHYIPEWRLFVPKGF